MMMPKLSLATKTRRMGLSKYIIAQCPQLSVVGSAIDVSAMPWIELSRYLFCSQLPRVTESLIFLHLNSPQTILGPSLCLDVTMTVCGVARWTLAFRYETENIASKSITRRTCPFRTNPVWSETKRALNHDSPSLPALLKASSSWNNPRLGLW